MIKRLYAILDTVSESIIGGVHVQSNDTAAIRMFSDIAAANESYVGAHMPDFNLIQIAELDDTTGTQVVSERILPHVVLSGQQLYDMFAARDAAEKAKANNA